MHDIRARQNLKTNDLEYTMKNVHHTMLEKASFLSAIAITLLLVSVQPSFGGEWHKQWKDAKKDAKRDFSQAYDAFKDEARDDPKLMAKLKNFGLKPDLNTSADKQFDNMFKFFKQGLGKKMDSAEKKIEAALKDKKKGKEISDKDKDKIRESAQKVVDVAMEYVRPMGGLREQWINQQKIQPDFLRGMQQTLNDTIGHFGAVTTARGLDRYLNENS